MEYVRTKDGRIHELHPYQSFENLFVCENPKALPYDLGGDLFYRVRKNNVVKQANKITDLITTGDLLIVEDLAKKVTFPIIYNEKVPFDYESPIYQLKEIYIKDTKSNFIKVAKMNEKGELELL